MFSNNISFPPHVLENFENLTADTENYRICMTVIKYRMHMIDKIMRNEIYIPYSLFKLESVYFHFRMVFELLYLSTIVARRKKFSSIWPKSTRVYKPCEIKSFVTEHQKGKMEDHFPHPYELKVEDSHKYICPLEKPISEQQIYDLFNKTHRYLHESNPYKKSLEKRQLECPALLIEAQETLEKLWRLLAHHFRVSELKNGKGAFLICNFGEEHMPVVTYESVSG